MPSHLITIEVFRAEDVTVVDGVLQGEPLGFADELVLDDLYALAPQAAMLALDLIAEPAGLRRKTGARNAVHLDCCLTLMAPDGTTHDALVLVEENAGLAVGIYLMALGDIMPDCAYRLVGIARETATRRFAEAAAGSFARGTRITMGDGTMQPVETLSPGDLVLTRDAGKQPLRHVTQATMRATGRFAPVIITQGALHNEADLVLRPDHRIFIYQRSDLLGTGHAEVLIRARQLVDGVTVLRKRGGYVDYFQLVLDDHHIIYAEGIAAESHLVDANTKHAMPAGAKLHRHRPHLDYEVRDSLIDPATAADLLRRASTC
ncbi:Hint domain-containing protein [Yoonia vestfoldensis]|uniref:Hint domain protein n=1 Tax=Yoonia vestfoldensis TaxID=245188 RepID=A0A1Y0EC67_9RHOB|nr:Hint domain-containing protein [Yoonia vestfoldensis]ARU01088.1 Hint domain protein [Yoonia vestfoldensis]